MGLNFVLLQTSNKTFWRITENIYNKQKIRRKVLYHMQKLGARYLLWFCQKGAFNWKIEWRLVPLSEIVLIIFYRWFVAMLISFNTQYQKDHV
jgi:hypothetical protein